MPVDCRNRQRRVLRPLLVLLMLCIGAAAHAVGNKVSLDVRNAPLENVLRSIEKQTDYRFFYSKETVNVSNRVSVSARNESIRSTESSLARQLWAHIICSTPSLNLNPSASVPPK